MESSRSPPPLQDASKRIPGRAQSQRSQRSNHSTESTPLLARDNDDHNDNERANGTVRSSPASSLLRSIQGRSPRKGVGKRRWPSIIALVTLCVVIIAIMVGGFLAPEIIRSYAMEAAAFRPTSISIDSFTPSGIISRVQGDILLDASTVKNTGVRYFGRFGTWIAKEVEIGEARIQVLLPEYGSMLLGSVTIPPVKMNIRNGHTTHLDFSIELVPGPKEGIHRIANDLLEGKQGRLRVEGRAKVPVKSGIFSLGTQTVSQFLEFKGSEFPPTPKYNITRLKIREVPLPSGGEGLSAEVLLDVANEYAIDFPVHINIPPLSFAILMESCTPMDSKIMLAHATTDILHVEPGKDLALNVTGLIGRLPDEFLATCPTSNESPLDKFLSSYIRGGDTTIYVRGSESSSSETPQWITDITSGITVPVPVPGQTMGHLIRDFSMADVHFGLPNLFAKPNTPEAQPKISAKAKVLVALPDLVDFPVKVHRMRADSEVYYHGKKLGNLDLHKWRRATSRSVTDPKGGHADLEVETSIVNAPLNVTDDTVFSDFVGALLTSQKALYLTVKAKVDVEMETAIGRFTARGIPSEGEVPVKPISGGGFKSLAPQVGDMKIIETSAGSMTLSAAVNMTNPTDYSVTVPFTEVIIAANGTNLGRAQIKNASIVPGNNTNILMEAIWEPFHASGAKGVAVGRELLGHYISGDNTTLSIKMFNGTIPSQPSLGKALEKIEFSMPMPRLGPPSTGKGGEDERPHFIDSATMHLFSSTATFSLSSPLNYTTIYLTHMNATAFYHEDIVGKILYDGDIAIPPGISESPRLPVEWNFDSVGYEVIKKSLGGTLKLSTRAKVGVRIGKFEERLSVEFRGIGAKVRV